MNLNFTRVNHLSLLSPDWEIIPCKVKALFAQLEINSTTGSESGLLSLTK